MDTKSTKTSKNGLNPVNGSLRNPDDPMFGITDEMLSMVNRDTMEKRMVKDSRIQYLNTPDMCEGLYDAEQSLADAFSDFENKARPFGKPLIKW